MGNNVYKLILPKDLSRLHPVFHASLLLPFIDPKSFPGRIGSKAPHGPTSLNFRFWDEQDIELFLGYRQLTKNYHEYLVRWRGGSIADDSWERGLSFSPTLHPYMENIHELYGAQSVILPPEHVQRIPC
jgi:hypothetical protein